MNQAKVSKNGGMNYQTLHKWAHRYNEQEPDGLTTKEEQQITAEQMQELTMIVLKDRSHRSMALFAWIMGFVISKLQSDLKRM